MKTVVSGLCRFCWKPTAPIVQISKLASFTYSFTEGLQFVGVGGGVEYSFNLHSIFYKLFY